MKKGDKIYYSDELNDEVIDFKVKPKKIDKNYNYLPKNIFYRFISWFTYRFLAMPIFGFYFTFIRPVKFKNKKVLKLAKKTGYFVYGNHTNEIADAVCPTFACFPKKPHVICNSSNLQLPVLGKFLRMWGALPLPDTLEATKNFYNAIETTLNNKNPIIIYPEAHLWPYYTKIRPFTYLSFRYAIKYNKPVYCFTTVYKKRKFFKKPKMEIYVDGPFYPDTSLPAKESQQKLRDEVYTKMVERSKLNNCEYVTYEKRSEND